MTREQRVRKGGRQGVTVEQTSKNVGNNDE